MPEENHHWNTPKTAIVISHTYGDPFEKFYNSMQGLLWKDFKKRGIDVFYVIGETQPPMIRRYVKISNTFRYKGIVWIVQRIVDQFYLRKFNRKIPRAKLSGNTIDVEIPEGLPFLAAKMNAAYFFLIDEGYEVIYRTTLSSVVNLETLQRWARVAASNEFFYGGSLVNFGNRSFASGATLLLNRNAVELLRKNIQKWNHADLDDVAIGKLLENRIPLQDIFSINISNCTDLEKYTESDISRAIQVRCKTFCNPRNDDDLMKYVLTKFPNIQRVIA